MERGSWLGRKLASTFAVWGARGRNLRDGDESLEERYGPEPPERKRDPRSWFRTESWRSSARDLLGDGWGSAVLDAWNKALDDVLESILGPKFAAKYQVL